MGLELRYGKLKYISFIVLDLICLYLANMAAFGIYVEQTHVPYDPSDHLPVLIIMIVIDVAVALVFNTLQRVLRRRIRIELFDTMTHIMISFLLLCVILFTTKQGAEYSRGVVLLAYGIDYILLVTVHIFWLSFLQELGKKSGRPTALLISNDGFVEEGLQDLAKTGIDVKRILLLLNLHRNEISGIPVVADIEEAAAAICWEELDRVYIYGIDRHTVPEALRKACAEMRIKIDLVDFKYRILDVKTVQNKDAKYGSLTFLEERRDIPFNIRRVYWITETEANLQRGFHAHKRNCQLLFCPHGAIDIIMDDGEEKTVVTLDEPGKGLMLMPEVWHEMVWKESGSVLCVLASEYYDEEEYIRNYDDFVAYQHKREEDL